MALSCLQTIKVEARSLLSKSAGKSAVRLFSVCATALTFSGHSVSNVTSNADNAQRSNWHMRLVRDCAWYLATLVSVSLPIVVHVFDCSLLDRKDYFLN